jgi:hypothetical protein
MALLTSITSDLESSNKKFHLEYFFNKFKDVPLIFPSGCMGNTILSASPFLAGLSEAQSVSTNDNFFT